MSSGQTVEDLRSIPLLEPHWKTLGSHGLWSGDAESVFRELCQRYAEPHRAYHNITHLAECLEELSQSAHSAKDPRAVAIALWFHDAVYDPRRTDNEEA